jgi:hypothetical protein
MADGVDITAGSGTTVATDDTGAPGHVQLFKLAYSADGSATLIPADADGLKVNVTESLTDPIAVRLSDGSTFLGDVVGQPLFAKLSDGVSALGDALARPLVAKLSDGAAAIGNTLANPLTVRISDGAAAIGAAVASPLAVRLSDGAAAVATLANPLQVRLGDGTNPIGDLVGRPLFTQPTPATTGGLSMFTSLDLDETEEAVKGSAGQLYGWYVYNDGAAEVYVKLYNATTGTVTVGSTAADLTFGVPAGSAANVFNVHGIAFSTAITAAATTGATTADSGAPAANQVISNFFYS